MKKLVSLGMAMVLSLGLVACGGGEKESSEAADKLDALKERRKLVVAMSADYPPFEFHSTKDGADKVAGVDVDLANAVAKEIGVDVEVKEILKVAYDKEQKIIEEHREGVDEIAELLLEKETITGEEFMKILNS